MRVYLNRKGKKETADMEYPFKVFHVRQIDQFVTNMVTAPAEDFFYRAVPVPPHLAGLGLALQKAEPAHAEISCTIRGALDFAAQPDKVA